jgi:hypothetical protein
VLALAGEMLVALPVLRFRVPKNMASSFFGKEAA